MQCVETAFTYECMIAQLQLIIVYQCVTDFCAVFAFGDFLVTESTNHVIHGYSSVYEGCVCVIDQG